MIRIRAFRAVDDPDACERFAKGHQHVLQIYGVTKVTSANLDWMYNPGVYVLIAEDNEGKTLGGARVHVYNEKYPLPLQKAVEPLDDRINSKIKDYSLQKTAELCGLWNAKEVAGIGLGTKFLMWSGISLAQQLSIGSLFALCAQHTLQITLDKGFSIVYTMGNNGTFYYPKEDLLATLVIMKDPDLLSSAIQKEREQILDLAENPVQTRMEKTPLGVFKIDFELKVSNFVLC